MNLRNQFALLEAFSLCLVIAGGSAAAPSLAEVDAPCDSMQVGEQGESPVQIGFRFETRRGIRGYTYTVVNRTQDTLTAVQIGYNTKREVCELTGASPHFPPDTAYSPPGWDCGPLQTKEDSLTFTLGWKPAPGQTGGGGIPPRTMLSGFRVALPQPDSLYESCHWLIRFKLMPRAAYVGQVRPEAELDPISTDTGTISGRVVDELGRGIQHANVAVKGFALLVRTRSDGTYIISNVPVGRRYLAARAMGFSPCERGRILVASNDTTRADFRLAGARLNENEVLVPPCSAPHVDSSTWELVDRGKFTFRLPTDFKEIKVQGIDSYVGQFQTPDSSIVVMFDWGWYSDPLTSYESNRDVAKCQEKIGGHQARLVTLWPLDSGHRGFFGAGAAWRDITPRTHLTLSGWARDRRGLERLLAIFRTVRFPEER